MDEYLLNDLLECSVCLERLDTSSKVLPCQHTFCKKCLEEIMSTKKELRCPECRVLVTVTIDELPPNVLLMRILEGMRNAGNPFPKKKVVPVQRTLTAVMSVASPAGQTINCPTDAPSSKPLNAPKQSTAVQAMARALFDYQSLEPGDLCFKTGDMIVLKNRIDAHWAQGESGGKIGIFPLTFVQILTQLPPQVATCRALYDFRMNNDEVEGCLSFRKDEVLAVLRRVDENWVEGRLGGRIGIFPLAFVELNPVAKALMKLSSNEQPGPSRLAPPTPSDESIPLISTDNGAGVASAQRTAPEMNRVILSPAVTESNRPSNNRPSATTADSHQNPNSTAQSLSTVGSDSNSSTSTTTPNTSGTSRSGSSSSNSSTAPSSPASPQQQQQQSASQPLNPFMRPQTILLPTSHITTQQNRDKRHSFTAMTPSQPPPPPTNRHSAEILSSGELSVASQESSGQLASGQIGRDSLANQGRESSPSQSAINSSSTPSGQLVRQGSQRHRRSGSDFALVHLPAAYVALYPYKPHKADELELKKGGVYLVTERCQDGWFKGTSNRTQKCGVFPGNYVTLAKPNQNSHSRVVSSSPRESSIPAPMVMKPRSHSGLRPIPQSSLAPPDLPPRSASPAPRLHRHPWAFSSPPLVEPETMAVELPVGPAPAVPCKSEPTPRHSISPPHASQVANTVSPPPNVSVSLSPISSKPNDKVKEKKEKSSLMKRLAAIKRSKSPTMPAYSMDNPVFEDSSTPPPVLHAAHSRSGSCPSQLMQLPAGAHQQRVMSTSLSARVTRQKERPSMAAAQFAHAQSRGQDNSSPAPQLSGSHRKSSSLDAGDPRNPKHLVPSVRERFRCIVPYPPNSEYELELQVGDIIYVHRKREDGWYKGTQQRTGRTGLFPASFAEAY